MVRPVDSNLIQESNLSVKAQNPVDSSIEKKQASLALHQLFNKDVSSSLSHKNHSSSVSASDSPPSFWNRIYNWWYQIDTTTSTPKELNRSFLSEISDIEPIDSIPLLEEPDETLNDQIMARFQRKKTLQQDQINHKQLQEGIARMSEYTLEQVMFIILKGQIELEKENANATETTFSRYQQLQKLHENTLQEIKDALAKDTQWAGYLKKGQQATFILSIGAMLTAFVFPLSLVATVVAPAATAGLTALTTGTKAYFDRRTSEDKAKHEQFNHKDKYYTGRLDESRDNLISIADNDEAFKERLFQLSKRFARMCKLVLSK